MCRVPDSRPMRLVKKWLRGGTSTKNSARSRPLTTAGDAHALGKAPSRWRRQLSPDERSSSAQKPRRISSPSPSGCLVCASTLCWRRQGSDRDVDDELQQTIALVGRCHPFHVVQSYKDDECDTDANKDGHSRDKRPLEALPPSTVYRPTSTRSDGMSAAPIYRRPQPPPSSYLPTSVAVSLDGEERLYNADLFSVLRPDEEAMLQPPPNRVAPTAVRQY